MRVIRIHPAYRRYGEALIGDRLEDLQHEVDGYIEMVSIPQLSEKGILLIVNEEGLLKGLEPNTNLFPFFYVGNVLMCNRRDTDGELVSLTDEQVKFGLEWLKGLLHSD